MMGRPLRALIVEDQHQDALLLVRELTRGGFDVTFERVDTADAMAAALTRDTWDLVISDYSLPRFSGPDALALVKSRQLDLPFIIVSGTVGEEIAVESIRAGAHDFMTKGKYARLVTAIERELRDRILRAERAKLQEQLLISDRMVSVGTLAAGVAHEINNPLAALMANLDIATHDLLRLIDDVAATDSDGAWPDGTGARLLEIAEPLRDAREASDRVRSIVRDLMIFSRSHDEEKVAAVDVRRVMESSLRMAWNEIRHRARLVKDYGDVPPVRANEARLGQVFLNLLVNAAQATPEGRADKHEIRVVTRAEGSDRVVVEVRDSGAGIPEAIQARIFDPFFTTKPVGVGTGLGLAICHRIVTQLGGEIHFESQVGKGTVVRTVLPVAKTVSTTVPPPIIARTRTRRGRILVVDDDVTLGVAVRRRLSNHEVRLVTEAREALRQIAGGERFDAILCDLMMPEMTGMDLHTELGKVDPPQADRMIFMTGGAFTSRAREFLDSVMNPRLEKPFEISALNALIHGLLR